MSIMIGITVVEGWNGKHIVTTK